MTGYVTILDNKKAKDPMTIQNLMPTDVLLTEVCLSDNFRAF